MNGQKLSMNESNCDCKKRSNINKAFFIAQAEFDKLDGESRNGGFNSKYANLGEVYSCVRKALRDNGIMVRHDKDVHPESKEQLMVTIVEHAATGERYESTCFLRPDKPSQQGWGAAETYMKRYTLCSMLGIAIGEKDDDGESGRLYLQKVSEFRNLIGKFAPHVATALKEELKFNELKDLGDEGLFQAACFIIKNMKGKDVV